MLLTGRTIDAATALDWGIVSRVAEHQEVVHAATHALIECCRSGPEARAATKRTFHEFYGTYDRIAMDASLGGD